MEPGNDWLASDVGDIQDIDLEVYGSKLDDMNTAPTNAYVTSYSFEVCDSLLNVGPCSHVAMGEPAFLSEELTASTKADPDVELVSTSGHGKNGALCVLQQTVRNEAVLSVQEKLLIASFFQVRPHVVTTFELPGVHDMWTVIGKDSEVEDELGHAFLILSK